MAVLAGIDEAGFGPILGPLIVSSSVFSLPHELLEADLWSVLSKSVSQTKKGISGRLLITDSKKAYSRAIGIKHLRRTVLACLRCLGAEPDTLGGLVAELCPDCLERLSRYPWYLHTGEYRLGADSADLKIASSLLANDMRAHQIRLLELRSRCLDVAYYNKMVSTAKNKARVLFTAASQLVKSAFDKFGGDDLHIIIDRQGGRSHYRRYLQMMFPEAELKVITENGKISSYQLGAGQKQMRLHFVVAADQRFLPVSLASMVSKYIRELLVDNINRYFLALSPGLKPTAGYWKDGLRFIDDIKTAIPHAGFDSNQLIRCR